MLDSKHVFFLSFFSFLLVCSYAVYHRILHFYYSLCVFFFFTKYYFDFSRNTRCYFIVAYCFSFLENQQRVFGSK